MVFLMALGAASLGLLRDGFNFFIGNIHDIFVPYNAAYSVQTGMRLHVDFHTAFGWIYPYLNAAAFSLIKALPGALNFQDLISVASLLFASLLALLYWASRKSSPRPEAMPLWLMVVILSMALTMRALNLYDYRRILWYSIYNYHMWALLWVQLSLVFSWEAHHRDMEPYDRAAMGFALMAMLQGVFLYIAFHYKVNYFLAGALVAAGLVFYMRPKAALSYVFIAASVFGAGVLVTHLAGYSYGGYYDDLMQAAHAQAVRPKDYFEAETVMFFAFLRWVRWQSSGTCAETGTSFAGTIRPFVGFALRPGREMAFDLLVSLGVLMSLLGANFRNPIIFLLVAAMFMVASGKCKEAASLRWLYRIAPAVLVLFGLLNLAAIARVAEYKSYDGGKGMYINASFNASDNFSGSGNRRFDFVVMNDSDYEDMLRLFDVRGQKGLVPTLFRMTVKRETGLTYTNMQFISSVDEAAGELRAVGAVGEARVFSVDFVNPFPVLLGASMPDKAQHWMLTGPGLLQVGGRSDLIGAFNASDFLLLPVTKLDERSKALMNCIFYQYNNEEGHPFRAFGATPYWAYFARAGYLSKIGVPEVQEYRALEPELLDSCQKVRSISY